MDDHEKGNIDVAAGEESSIPLTSSSAYPHPKKRGFEISLTNAVDSIAKITSLSNHASSPKSRSSVSQLEYLNGLRAVACWLVFTSHIATAMPKHTDGSDPMYLVSVVLNPCSTIGVGMFYILSGRVLAMSFLKKEDPSLLASSILRRPIRLIWPAIGAQIFHIVFATLGLYHYGTDVKERFPAFSMVVTSSDYIQLCFNYTGGPLPKYPAGVQWTLPHEMAGSFFTFTIAFVMSYYPKRKWIFAAYFIGGLAVAELKSALIPRAGWRKWAMILGCSVFLMGWYGSRDFQDWIDNTSGPISIEDDGNFGHAGFWGAMALLILAETSQVVRWVLESPPVRFMAKVSFGLYLMHPIASASVGTWVVSMVAPGPDKIENLNYFQAWSIYLSTLAMSIFLGWLFYLTADKQSIVLGKWLENAML
ncbi:hypothetical protein BC829DRAFT_381151 [Chytridium lagenaria]|nr:hypothetical protein BC829DRAFT_381151 [Chytridium lagenaria]